MSLTKSTKNDYINSNDFFHTHEIGVKKVSLI